MVINICFAPHWIELLAEMRKLMKSADIIILEEPANDFFKSMLDGIISVDEYIQFLSEETFSFKPAFPLYTGQLCLILKSMHMKGKRIFQVEPYLETVEEIYKFIDEQERQGIEAKQIISEIKKSQKFSLVYDHEHITYKLLLEYYNSWSKGFDNAVDALLQYSKAEAKKLILRSKMRAEKIIDILKDIDINKTNIFIESGNIHLYLYYYLHQHFGDHVNSIYLLNVILRKLNKKQNYLIRPNDILTFMHMFNIKDDELERTLAARNIIRLIMINENELIPSKKQPFPKIEEEFLISRFVSSLNYNECKQLYYKFKQQKT